MGTVRKFVFLLPVIGVALLLTGCLHYTLKESSIPKEIKTIHIGFIGNNARYNNPQLSPQLTEKLRQKVISQTNRTLIQGDNADLDISGAVTDYSFTTAAIADNRSATNRLNITVHIVVVDRTDEKKSREEDVTRSFDFDANVSIQQAETALNESIIKNLTDEIFNRLFSNW